MFNLREQIGIGGKVTALLLILLAVAAVNVGAVYYVQQETSETTNTIEVANKQSVLSQKIAFHAFRKAERENAGTQLRAAIEEYDRNLAALDNGTSGSETVAGGLQTEPVPPEARGPLSEQKRVWRNYSTNARTVASEDPFNETYTAAVENVTENEEELTDRSQSAVEAYRNQDGDYTTEIAVARELRIHRQGIVAATSQHSQAVGTTVRFENRLRTHLAEYERLLGLLADGGTFNGQRVTPAPSAVQQELDSLRTFWAGYRNDAETVIEVDRLNSAFWTSLRYIETHSADLNNASTSLADELNAVVQAQEQFLQRLLIGLFVLNVGVALACVVWVRRRVTSPLKTVTEKATDIAEQDIDVEIPETDRGDEIGRLFRSFEQMRSNIQLNIQELRNARSEAEEARELAETARDDAQQARADAERLNEQLQVLDRLLRHNLKNDMNVIKLEAEWIQREESGEAAAHADKIVSKTVELLEKTDKQRQITHALGTKPTRVKLDVASVLRSLVDEQASKYPNATVTLETPEKATAVGITIIDVAFRELIENAIVHNDATDPVVEVTVTTDESHTRVHVADNGPQLPEVEKSVLRGNQNIGPLNHASGMGLWLVFWSVCRSEGQLTYESRESRGNVVTVELRREAHFVEPTERQHRGDQTAIPDGNRGGDEALGAGSEHRDTEPGMAGNEGETADLAGEREADEAGVSGGER